MHSLTRDLDPLNHKKILNSIILFCEVLFRFFSNSRIKIAFNFQTNLGAPGRISRFRIPGYKNSSVGEPDPKAWIRVFLEEAGARASK